MKKIFSVFFAVFVMSLCVLAENEGTTFTLTEYLGLNTAHDLVERVEFIIPDGNKMERREISKDAFLTLTETIILTDVEGAPMFVDENGMAVMEWNIH